MNLASENWAVRIGSLIFFCGALAFVIGARASFFLLIAFTGLAWLLYRPGPAALSRPPALVLWSSVFVLFGTLSALWSLSFGESVRQTLPALASILMAYVVALCLSRAPAAELSRFAWWSMIGGVIGVVYVAVEIVSGHAVFRWVVNALPLLKPDSRSVYARDGAVFLVAPSYLNWSIAAINLMVWPAILTASSLRLDRPWQVGCASALWLLVAATTFLSEHQTSMIALVAASIAFVVARWLQPATVRKLAAAACILIVLGTPLIVVALQKALPASWLPATGVARIGIWTHLTSKLPEAPILGVGVRSIRVDVKPKHAQNKGQAWKPELALHAHNIYLQTWYELGVVGAGLLLLACLALLRTIDRLEPFLQPFGYATFASAVLIGFSSWEIWTFWFPAAYALTLLGFLVAAKRRQAEVAA